ncbi:M48 family metallopeptidase [Moraxella marmotae]|uniref:M48 family metallopeptidase n=1 Tax=Moraxella marmotae TaxID=3344520 RepID=UPI0035F4C0C5
MIDTTSTTAKRIQAVFQRIVPYADKANNTGIPFSWEITVFRSDEMNAWAMPGGRMAFFTGLVETLDLSDDEIAAIVGHEMAHALEEHRKEKENQSLVSSLLVVGMAYAGVGSVSEIALASDFGKKGYSRAKEKEADRIGLFLMAQAGFNPQAGISVWEKSMAYAEKQKQLNGDKNKFFEKRDNRILIRPFAGLNKIVESLSSTHPADKERIQAMKDLQPQVMPLYQAALQGKAEDFVVPTNVKKPVGERVKGVFGKNK